MSNHVDGSSGLNAPGAVFHGDVTVHLAGDDARTEPRTRGTERLLLRVLQREFHDGATVRLLDPALVREHRGIAEAFVDLLVRLPSKDEGEESAGGAPRHFVKQYLAMETASFRTVLTGGPGQGKTTAVQMLAHLHRAHLLRTCDAELLSPRTVTELDRVERGLRRLELAPPATARFPLWVEADAFASYLTGATETRRSLWHHLAHRYERLLQTEVSTAEVRTLARSAPTVLILDGYDEVSPRQRSAVLGHVRDFADDLQLDRADASIIVTSRPQAYGNDLRPHGFASWTLADLTPDEAQRHAAVLAGDGAAGERLLGLFSEAARHGDLPDILNTPLHVALVVSILAGSGELPSGRHRLFARYYDHVYAREEGRGGELGTFLEQHRGLVDELHRRAAFHIMVASERRQDARGIRAEEFAAMARSVVRDIGAPTGADEAEVVERLQRFARERLVLIVGVDTDVVGFQIKSLVEFLAAAHLSETADEQLVRERFRAVAASEPWRNVARFMAAAAFEPGRLGVRDLRDSVVTALAELDLAEFTGTASLYLRGAELAIDLLADLPELDARYVHHLLPDVDVIADLDERADRLARAAAPLFEGPRLDELLDRMTTDSPGRRHSLALWRFLNKLAEAGNAVAGSAARAHLDSASPQLLPDLLLDVAIPEVVGPEQLAGCLPRADPHAVRTDAHARRIYLPAWAEAAWEVMHSGATSSGFRSPVLEDIWPLSGPNTLLDSRWLWPLATPPDGCHPNWAAWGEAASMLATPTTAVLDSLARKRSDFPDFSASRMLPWPVREWLVGGGPPPQTPDSLAWLAAENRWAMHGVRLHDIETYLRKGSLDSHVASSGFPFATIHWALPAGSDPRIFSLAADVWSIWSAQGGGLPTARATIAERLLLPLCEYGLERGDPPASPRQLREAIGCIPALQTFHLTYETALLALSDCPDDAEFAALAQRLSLQEWSSGKGTAHDVIARARRLLYDGTFRSLCATVAELNDAPETWDALVAHWIAHGDPGHEDWPLVSLLRVDAPWPSDRDIALARKSVRGLGLGRLADNVPYWSDELRAHVRDRVQLQEAQRWGKHPDLVPWHEVTDPLPLALLKLRV
ncbi:NACHT domain-containing protein [Streptomyces sp. NPDC058308]|uniref:NACHT domain-containing protein n=1 Tax=Streptomyces sp. NPDC058308 TaxID=3346440 RepID=UPI0036E24563